MINIIGDSHAFRLVECKTARVYWLSVPSTAHNLFVHRDDIKTIIDQYPNEKWYFWYGDIDCRIHIYLKQCQLGLDRPDSLIQETINRYVSFLTSLPYSVAVFAVPPEGFEENIYGFEYYADRQTRQEITDLFNEALRLKCSEESIEFVDLTPEFRYGLVERECFEDDVHMRNDILIDCLTRYVK